MKYDIVKRSSSFKDIAPFIIVDNYSEKITNFLKEKFNLETSLNYIKCANGSSDNPIFTIKARSKDFILLEADINLHDMSVMTVKALEDCFHGAGNSTTTELFKGYVNDVVTFFDGLIIEAMISYNNPYIAYSESYKDKFFELSMIASIIIATKASSVENKKYIEDITKGMSCADIKYNNLCIGDDLYSSKDESIKIYINTIGIGIVSTDEKVIFFVVEGVGYGINDTDGSHEAYLYTNIDVTLDTLYTSFSTVIYYMDNDFKDNVGKAISICYMSLMQNIYNKDSN